MNRKAFKRNVFIIFMLLIILITSSCMKNLGGGTMNPDTNQTADILTIDIPEVDKDLNLPDNMADARVVTVNGRPRLYINGRLTQPIMFYGNNLGHNWDGIEREIAKAGNNDIHVVGVGLNIKKPLLHTELNRVMKMVLNNNPDAYIILRISPWWNAEDFGLDGSIHNYKNQKGEIWPIASLGSDAWYDKAKTLIRKTINTILETPEYAERVIGYHFCAGDTGEWFGPRYWDGDIDCSQVNTEKFREYLKEKYQDLSKLREAWGDENLTFESVEVPSSMVGLGPGYDRFKDDETIMFDKSKRVYIDYLDYYNGLIAGRIAGFAEVVKKETGGRSLAVTFYGYHTEVRVPASGSFGLGRLLECPEIDVISGPVSYADRNEGGIGAYMPFVSTVASAGKLWFDEADYRSPIRTSAGFEAGVGDEGNIASLELLIEVAKREIGKCMVFNTGAWFFDLVARGWYDDDGFWREISRLQDLYEKYAVYQTHMETPEVAVILDERAMNISGDPWQMGSDLMGDFRHELYRSGLSFGMYLIEDVIDNRVPDARLYIMLNPWRIDEESAENIAKVVNRPGKTSLWVYGSGMTDEESFEKMSGFRLKKVYNVNGANHVRFNEKALEMLNYIEKETVFGSEVDVLYTVDTEDAVTLGKYTDIEGAGMAALERNDFKSVFLGNTRLSREILRSIGEYAGANVFIDTNETFYACHGLAVLHTNSDGRKTVSFSETLDVYDYFNDKWYTGVNSYTFNAEKYHTYYLFYGNKEEFQRAGIGKEQ